MPEIAEAKPETVVTENPLERLSRKVKEATTEVPVEVETKEQRAEKVEVKKEEKKPVEEKKVEPVVEKKVETPVEEVVVDTKLSKKEKLKSELLGKKTTTTTDPNKPAEATKHVLPSEVQQRLDYLEGVIKETDVAAVLAAKAQGKNLFQITDELKGVDPDKISVDDLFNIKLERLGITDPEDIKEEILAFSQKTKSEKIESVINTREQLRLERDKKLKDFISTTDQNSKQTQSLFQATASAYDGIVKSKIGQQVLGVVVTPEMAENLGKMEAWAQNGQNPIEPEKLFMLNFFYKYGDFAIEELSEKFYAAGAEMVDNKITVTGAEKATSVIPNLPVTGKGMTEEQKVDSITKARKENK